MKLFSSAFYATAEKLEKVALFQWLRPAILTNPLQKKKRPLENALQTDEMKTPDFRFCAGTRNILHTRGATSR